MQPVTSLVQVVNNRNVLFRSKKPKLECVSCSHQQLTRHLLFAITAFFLLLFRFLNVAMLTYIQPQESQARCINYREFRYCFAYYERFKDFV